MYTPAVNASIPLLVAENKIESANGCVTAVQALSDAVAPIILRGTMQSTDTMYGVGLGLISFGAILGVLTIGIFAKKLRMNTLYRWLIAIMLLLLPIAVAVMPFMLKLGYYPSFILFLLGIIPIAVILMLLDIFVISKVQKKTSNMELRLKPLVKVFICLYSL